MLFCEERVGMMQEWNEGTTPGKGNEREFNSGPRYTSHLRPGNPLVTRCRIAIRIRKCPFAEAAVDTGEMEGHGIMATAT
jgi:hypothetical protein